MSFSGTETYETLKTFDFCLKIESMEDDDNLRIKREKKPESLQ